MSGPVVLREEVESPDRPVRAPGRPHVAVLVSLNLPDLTESVAGLHRRFTRVALSALGDLDASHQLLDTTDPSIVETAVEADALVVLGGGDIAASCHDGPVPGSYGVDGEADRVSMEVIRAYIDADRPVFGICRGSQLINVAYGDTIIGDITDYTLHHGRPGKHLFVDEKIVVAPHTRLATILGEGPLVVRSGHHQAVEHPSKWVVGVQFHPEDDDGPLDGLRNLFASFLLASSFARPTT